jgi:hypothetical protein
LAPASFCSDINESFFWHFTRQENILKTQAASKRIVNTGENSQNFGVNSAWIKK